MRVSPRAVRFLTVCIGIGLSVGLLWDFVFNLLYVISTRLPVQGELAASVLVALSCAVSSAAIVAPWTILGLRMGLRGRHIVLASIIGYLALQAVGVAASIAGAEGASLFAPTLVDPAFGAVSGFVGVVIVSIGMGASVVRRGAPQKLVR